MKLEYHRLVRAELAQAFDWYEDHRAGLGSEFLDIFEAALPVLLKRPRSFGLWGRSHRVRRMKLPGFPYDVLFCILSGRIRISVCGITGGILRSA